jgi:cation:H+ antiporter
MRPIAPAARQWTWIALAALVTAPGLGIVLGTIPAGDVLRALLFGVAIVGAAFLISWAAEVAQLDVSQGLALAVLALIAILPEYLVDASFAWLAAEDPAYAGYAVANMTGANRLLLGIAWPLVIVIAFVRFRRTQVALEPAQRLEFLALLAATLYAFTLPFKAQLTLVDMIVLVTIFAFYVWRLAGQPASPPHLVGPAALLGALPPLQRRLAAAALAIAAAGAILLVAKPFAQALVRTGISFGIDEFLLVQWVAPLASEAPEFVVVALFAWRGMSAAALGTLISSKVNQWTLLVAMLPLVYSFALGRPDALPLDSRQRAEILLTAAQSLFALSLIVGLRLSLLGAATLFALFVVQAALPDTRGAVTLAYLALTPIALFRGRRGLLSALSSLRLRRPGQAVADDRAGQPR